MRTGVDSLLGRIAEFAPIEVKKTSESAVVSAGVERLAPRGWKKLFKLLLPRRNRQGAEPGAAAAKSVRIALVPSRPHDEHRRRAGHQPHAHGRSRRRIGKTGRTLSFSKERLQGKVGEFQEKYEFTASAPRDRPALEQTSASKNVGQRRCGRRSLRRSSASSKWIATTISTSSRAPWRKFPPTSTKSSRNSRATSAASKATSTSSQNSRHHLQDEITAARMVPIGTLYSMLRAPYATPPNPPKRKSNSIFPAAKRNWTTTSSSKFPIPSSISSAIRGPRYRIDPRIASPQESRNWAKSSLRAYHRGNHIYIEVEDDGRGIDYERVTAKARWNAAWSPPKQRIASPSATFAKCFSIPASPPPPSKQNWQAAA